MKENRWLYMFKAIFILTSLTVLFLLAPSTMLAYNKSWDQGHQTCVVQPGTSNWGKFDKSGVFHGGYTSKDCCEQYCKVCPVYANTGQLQKTYTDLIVPGVGPSLKIVRTYNSQDWSSSLLGNGWAFNFGRRLIISRSSEGEKIVGVLLETGEKNFYKENTDGSLDRLTQYGATYEIKKNENNTYTIIGRNKTKYEIKEDGKIEKIVDKNGNQLVFSYNSVGCLSRITNASGNYAEFQLGPSGKIASVSDNLGRTISYTYDQNGNLISQTDSLGNMTQYVYNPNNLLTNIIDARGNVVESATYDNNQPPRVATFTEKGETYSISYFLDRTEKTDSKNNKWTYYFNDVGVIERIVDPLGNEIKQQLNKLTSTSADWKQDAKGNQIAYVYDEHGNITTVTSPSGNVWMFTYLDNTNWLTSETNPIGVVTRYEYDAKGNVTSVTRDFGGPLENAKVFTYDSRGNQISMTNSLGYTTTYDYDINGNRTKITDPIGNVRTFTFDVRGNRLSETNPLGSKVTYSYDILDRLVSVTDPLGNTTIYSYDACGNQVMVRLPNGEAISYEYDAHNRLILTRDPMGNTQSYAYDTRGNLIKITDAAGNELQYNYDLPGRRTSANDEEGNYSTYHYDAAGNILDVTDSKGNQTSFKYDSNNRLIKKIYSDGASYTYEYDALGRRTTQKDPNGNTIELVYDNLNRLVKKRYADGSSADFKYDNIGRMISALTEDSTLSYIFDPLGRIVSSTQNGKTVQYGYDSAGNRIRLITPEGEIVNYQYNEANILTEIRLSSGKGIAYKYSPEGKIARIDYTSGIYSSRSYDKAGQLKSIDYWKGDDTLIFSQANLYDNVGNLLKKTTQAGTTSYSYNRIYRLIGADYPEMADDHFTYDAGDNRVGSADHNNWNYNNRDQLIGYGTTIFSFDNNGNTLSRTNNNGTTFYQYNYENRLSIVNLDNGGQATYKYDVRGRRVQKSFQGIVTRYLYDGDTLLAEYDETGALKRNYFSSDQFNPSMLLEKGQLYFFLSDHLGTPQRVVNETGEVEWSAEYKAFGDAHVSINSLTNNVRFPGQYFDEETRLHYNRYRYYDTETGRFFSPDPIRLIGGINLYVYAHLNPINAEDPLGLYSITISREEYWEMWKNSHPGMTPEQFTNLEAVLNRGCIGITEINLYEFGNASLADCYDTFAHAKQRQDQMRGECTCQGKNTLMGNPGDAKIFSKRFWSSGDPYTPDPSTGQVDMSGYNYSARPGGYTNFDYGWYDEASNLWIHANHFHDPGGLGPMKVYKSDLEHYSRSLLDFDKQVFCVACEN